MAATAVDAAIQSFLSLPAAIAAIYNAVGDRRIARSDFGFAIVDWTSYMVSIEPYIRRGLGYQDIELQARRILDLCAWLGYWLYSIGFRQSCAVAKRLTIQSLRFPYLWLNKKCRRFEAKLELIKSEGERLKETLNGYGAGQAHAPQLQSQDENRPVMAGISTAPLSSKDCLTGYHAHWQLTSAIGVGMLHESTNNLSSVSTRLLKS
ncbi:predicted protein [Uncinocarpus reesii 1704]|uniref:Uncharacterized protein n=1 Tax=Uncinocarpus reesii (strain UAMH 1704) TaxID=336963 RepID=C4JZL0_UNCRE|nr:uncharacterized protein UREG_07611 [Uncinocarpus reesii 1704]EEP82746.1 predicted protein [Uncinocarpus reesii 1704]